MNRIKSFIRQLTAVRILGLCLFATAAVVVGVQFNVFYAMGFMVWNMTSMSELGKVAIALYASALTLGVTVVLYLRATGKIRYKVFFSVVMVVPITCTFLSFYYALGPGDAQMLWRINILLIAYFAVLIGALFALSRMTAPDTI